MTCIAGFIKDGTVWMGADSLAARGATWHAQTRADSKIFINGHFLIGFTDSYRMGQLLQYSFIPPDRPTGMDVHQYMATHFINRVRKCLELGGYASKSDGVEEGGEFMAGYMGRLFVIHDNYQVAESVDCFNAVGCGAQVALGALSVPMKDRSPGQRILYALKAAADYTSGVRGPFHILSMPSENKTP